MGRSRELAELGSAYDSGNSLGFRNRIINGDMRIDQRNAGASVAFTNNVYTLDRWVSVKSSSAVGTVQQNAGAVTPPAGFTNYLGVTCTTGATPASGDYNMLWHKFEGFNTADLAWGTASAQPITVSFWVRSSLTGTFAGAVFNSTTYANGYLFNFNIPAANTWTFCTVSIPGPTSGTWQTGNANSITLSFDLGTGSGSFGTAGSWGAVGYTTSGATRVMATTGATFYITGVQLEAGSVATPFERRPYGTELALCQRYYTNSFPAGTAPADSAASGVETIFNAYSTAEGWSSFVSFPVQMRATPTMVLYKPTGIGSTAGQWVTYDASAFTSLTTTSVNAGSLQSGKGFSIVGNRSGAFTAKSGYIIVGSYAASAEL